MKVRLLAPDRDILPDARLMRTHADLVRDLGVGQLLAAMAGGDRFVYDVAADILLDSLQSCSDIRFRQAIAQDWLRRPELLDELYGLAAHATAIKDRVRTFVFGDHPTARLNRAVALLRDHRETLSLLRGFVDRNRDAFRSAGLRTLMSTIGDEIDADYLTALDDHIKRLGFAGGVVMTARLNRFCGGTGYVLRRPTVVRRGWQDALHRLTSNGTLTYRLPDRDENGARTLARLRDIGVGQVSYAAADAADHVLDFFIRLRWELAFYVAANQLHGALRDAGAPLCIPEPRETEDDAWSAARLCDPGLFLRGLRDVVGNELSADARDLLVVTGANEGGKSTFARSLGLAQLMMQAGLLVTADAYAASLASVVLTHYRREEDDEMTSGKLDEELRRMSRLVDAVQPHALVVFNESFACTNEREGAQIAYGIVRALNAAGVRVVFVTHMYALSSRLAAESTGTELFLRAERDPDGHRTHLVGPGEPETTSYGDDLYREIFAYADADADARIPASRTSR